MQVLPQALKLDAREHELLLSFLTEEKLNGGETLFEYEMHANSLFFLTKGRLAVYKYTGFQKKMQVVALLDPTSVVGEASLLANHVHKTNVSAIDDCELFVLSRTDFERLQDREPSIAMRLLEYLLYIVSVRLEKTSERMAHVL